MFFHHRLTPTKPLSDKRLVGAQFLGTFTVRLNTHFMTWIGGVIQQDHVQRLGALLPCFHLCVCGSIEWILHQCAVVEYEQPAATAALQRHLFFGQRPLVAVFTLGDGNQLV